LLFDVALQLMHLPIPTSTINHRISAAAVAAVLAAAAVDLLAAVGIAVGDE
jgi:hypothetical protein